MASIERVTEKINDDWRKVLVSKNQQIDVLTAERDRLKKTLREYNKKAWCQMCGRILKTYKPQAQNVGKEKTK